MDNEGPGTEDDQDEVLDAGAVYSDSPWRGISCMSSFWPYSGVDEVFEVRRAISNCTHGLRQTRESVSPFAGIMGDSVDVADVLQFVSAADSILKAADSALDEVVAEARVRGATWEQIGEVRGVGRKAAHKRFSKGISERRRDEIEREGMVCLGLFAVWIKEVPESAFGFSDEDWESAPIEVFVDHAIRNAIGTLDLFQDVIHNIPTGEPGEKSNDQFTNSVIRAYRIIRRAVETLSLPRCFSAILKHSQDDMAEYPWVDWSTPAYYTSFVTHLRLALHHFTRLIDAYDENDGGKSFAQHMAYVYYNLNKAIVVVTRPELVKVVGRIEQFIVDSGNAVFVPGDPSARAEDGPSFNELIELAWKKDYEKVASALGVQTPGPTPSLDQLLKDVENAYSDTERPGQ